MKLYELEYQLALARALGAEDNTEVSFDVHLEHPCEDAKGEPTSAPIDADGPLQEVAFERGPRHEIVLR